MAWGIPAYDNALKVCKRLESAQLNRWKGKNLRKALNTLKFGQRYGGGGLFLPSFHPEIYRIAQEIARRRKAPNTWATIAQWQ